MATEKPKTRKPNPQARPEPAWRTKRTENIASKRYSRTELLALYSPSSLPNFSIDLESIAEVHLLESESPALPSDQPFQHHLGEEINARERVVKMPDWYSESSSSEKKPVPEDRNQPEPPQESEKAKIPDPKPVEIPMKPVKVVIDKNAVIRNLPKDLESFDIQLEVKERPQSDRFHEADFYQEEFSKLDLEMEKRLKQEEEEDSAVPEWANEAESSKSAAPATSAPLPEFDSRLPKFHIDLLQDQIKSKDPFARLIFHYGVPDTKGFMCCIPYSLPLEKAWFYKDPQNKVQGPFSSIEMYNWNLVGYFSPNLQVAWRASTAFVQLVDLQNVQDDFWGRESDLSSLIRPVVSSFPKESKPTAWGQHFPMSVPSKAKHTLEIDPSNAIKSMLGLNPESVWGQKSDSRLEELRGQGTTNRKR